MKLHTVLAAVMVLVFCMGRAWAAEYVYYVDTSGAALSNGDVHELRYNGTSWTDTDLTKANNFTQSCGGVMTAYPGSNGARYVFYLDPNYQLTELIFLNGAWQLVHPTQNVAPPGVVPAVGTNLTSYIDASGQHVFYVSAISHLIHLSTTSCNGGANGCPAQSWKSVDLGLAPTNAPLALAQGSMTSFSASGVGNVYYMSQNGNSYDLTQVLLNPGAAPQAQDLTQSAQAGNPQTALIGFSDSWGNHVFYGNNGQLDQTYCSGGCVKQILTPPSAPPGSYIPMSAFDDPKGEHVYYEGTQNHLIEATYDGSKWSSIDFNTSPPNVAPIKTAGLLSFSDSGEHLFYLDAQQQLNELSTTYTPMSAGRVTVATHNLLVKNKAGQIIKPQFPPVAGFVQ